MFRSGARCWSPLFQPRLPSNHPIHLLLALQTERGSPRCAKPWWTPGPLCLGLMHITCLSLGREVLRAAGRPATVTGVPRGIGSPIDSERVTRSLGSQASVSMSISCSRVNLQAASSTPAWQNALESLRQTVYCRVVEVHPAADLLLPPPSSLDFSFPGPCR